MVRQEVVLTDQQTVSNRDDVRGPIESAGYVICPDADSIVIATEHLQRGFHKTTDHQQTADFPTAPCLLCPALAGTLAHCAPPVPGSVRPDRVRKLLNHALQAAGQRPCQVLLAKQRE